MLKKTETLCPFPTSRFPLILSVSFVHI
uniref:Uncharacterized protein n=1 Tax=Salix viminalis TaxID=40686 RepID=A0A6N2MTB5_SALVM